MITFDFVILCYIALLLATYAFTSAFYVLQNVILMFVFLLCWMLHNISSIFPTLPNVRGCFTVWVSLLRDVKMLQQQAHQFAP